MPHILEFYNRPPADGRVICVDGFEPLDLLPRKGKTWQRQGKPRRQRATGNRHNEVLHMLAALDLATGKIFYWTRTQQRANRVS